MKKLDELIKRNVPETSAPLKALVLPPKSANWIKGLAVSATLVLVIVVTQNMRLQKQVADLDTLHEVMLWDLTEDEAISEVDEVVAFIE